MSWTEATNLEKLASGNREVVKIGDQKILLINQEGKIYAVSNACPHLKLPMKTGKINSDCTITCPFHRSSFDLATGEVKEWSPFPPVIGNLMGKISKEKSLPVFETRIEGDKIMVNI